MSKQRKLFVKLQHKKRSILLGFMIIAVCMIKVPDTDSNINLPYFDKAVHFLMYFLLSAIYVYESSKNKSLSVFLINFKSVVYCALLAGAVELAQGMLTTTRSADFWDFLAGVAGAIMGCLAIGLIRRAFQ